MNESPTDVGDKGIDDVVDDLDIKGAGGTAAVRRKKYST